MRHCFHSILVICPGKPYEPVFLKKHVQDDLCNIIYNNTPNWKQFRSILEKTSTSESHIMGVSTTEKKELQLLVLAQTQCGGTKSPKLIYSDFISFHDLTTY